MKTSLWNSLAFRIALIGFMLSLLMAVVFYLIFQSYVYDQNKKSLLETEELSFNTHLTNVRDWYAERKREVILLSQNPLYRKLPDLDTIHIALVTQLPARQGPYLHYFVTDAQGNYTTTLLRRAGNLAYAPFFKDLKNGESIIDGYSISPSTGVPVTVLATPIFDEKFRIIGGFGLTIDLLAFHSFFRQRLLTASNTALFLTDENGQLIWSNTSPLTEGENIRQSSSIIPAFLAERATAIFLSPKYQDVLPAYVIFSGVVEGTPGFRLVKVTRLDKIRLEIEGLNRHLILLSLLFLLVMNVVLFLINKSWTRYYQKLRDVFGQVATGNFSVLAPEGGPSEMFHLAHGFNEMMHYIRQLIFYDTVTELPNRAFFEDFVKKTLKDPQFENSVRCLVVLSIDKFKNFNDSHGSGQGDRLLKMTAKRLVRALSKNAIVSRGNGAEYNLFLYNYSNRNQILETLGRLQKDNGSPYLLDDEKIYLTFSIGVAFYIQDAHTYEELMINASIAKNSAKKSGGNQIKTFNDSMKLGLSRQMQIEAHLHIAIEYNQFHQVYHPQIDARTNRVIGMEALIRWTSPELGPVPPSIFIPIAEESGLIKAIDRWSLLQACRQNKEWLDQGLDAVPISVNISSIKLEQADFVDELQQILNLTQLPPNLLELEITERLAFGGYEDIIARLEAIRHMGVTISIDDFGTGYSSLNYLQNLPIQRLKIDQSFVRDLPGNPQSLGIVNTIISMGRNFGLELVAEGVETVHQLNYIVEQGCHAIQGYYFSRPLDPPDMREILARGDIPPKAGSIKS